jgi:hypothetical protein
VRRLSEVLAVTGLAAGRSPRSRVDDPAQRAIIRGREHRLQLPSIGVVDGRGDAGEIPEQLRELSEFPGLGKVFEINLLDAGVHERELNQNPDDFQENVKTIEEDVE